MLHVNPGNGIAAKTWVEILGPTPMPDKNASPRRPLLTRKEQTVLVFLLALLVVGGIVRKLRMEWHTSSSVAVRKT
jgi:hypothetical protein